MSNFSLRPLYPSDSLEELTSMLHRAYKPLADQGMNYTASDQTVDVTRERTQLGVCFVACSNDDQIIGCVCCHKTLQGVSKTWYRRASVWVIEMLAVEPDWQGKGVGSALLSRAEAWACEQGADETALDSAAKAKELIDFYLSRGYSEVDFTRWQGKNYESLIFAKELM